MSKSTISIPGAKRLREGKNLDLLLRYARKAGGVRRIEVRALRDHFARTGAAEVYLVYADGAVGATIFVSFTHAVDWAWAQSAGNRASWFAGCEVVVLP